jgi:hypothetical protein
MSYIIAFILVGIVAAFIVYRKLNNNKYEYNRSIQVIPTSAPVLLPLRWTGRGRWAIPFKVRYAAAFGNGGLGPWSAWIGSSQFSNPIIHSLPKPKDSSVPIVIYRQFEGGAPRQIGTVAAKDADKPFVDTYGDDH